MAKEVKFSEICNFQLKQMDCLKSVKDFTFTLYGGAAGGGKSYALRFIAVYLLLYYAKKYGLRGVRVGLFCEDYPALKERHLAKVQFEFPEWLGTLNRAEHEFRLADSWGAGVLAFRNLDDPSKYLSSEFAAVLVDELTKNKRDAFDFLNMRRRWPGITDTKFVGATNPGGIGHAWVKKLWIDQDFEGENYDPKDFKFVPARAIDNKFLGAAYEKQLDQLSDNLRKAYKDGDWNLFAGQYFTEWRESRHVIEPFAIPEGWVKFRCLDYGQVKPSAVYWCAVDYDGRIYVYRELYETGHTYPSLALKISDMTPHTEKIEYTVADTSVFDTSKESGRDGKELFAENGCPIIPANKNRIIGWNLVRQYLRQDMIKFFSTCKQAIRTIPSLVYKEGTEDCDTGGDDHSGDAIRYGLSSRPPLSVQNLETKMPNIYANDPDAPWNKVSKTSGYNSFYSHK